MRRVLLVALLVCATVATSPVHSAQPVTDVRVLIDISGSMRQNDPDSLRQPALRMLVGLMQPGTQAGVWTFARWVNMLVPHGDVNAAWKKRATSLSKQIRSPGQFTNIEEVLKSATRGWKGGRGDSQRHLILLTDGMVDVSKVPGENEASRRRIVDQLTPQIKASGARVHTIALSDRADHELLETLAAETDGWYQSVADADELQRVFLKIFDKVGRPEGVPLLGNRFQVDRSIREATVLAFRSAKSPKTRLHSPDGQSYETSDLPGGIAWQSDQGYDLITISEPMAGEWRLEADVDPDNRVMIVTELKLETSALPNRLALGEQLAFTANLTNQGKIIDRRAFLDLVNMTAVSTGQDSSVSHPLNDEAREGDRTAGDGRYAILFGATAPRGEVELRITADSATFVREKRLVVDFVPPATLDVDAAQSGAVARLSWDKTVLAKLNSAQLYQEDPQGTRIPLATDATAEGHLRASLHDPAWPVKAELEANTLAGSLLQTSLGPVYVAGFEPPPDPVAVVPAAPVAAEPQLPEETASAPVVPEPEPIAAADKPDSWILPAAIFGGVNLLLMLGGGLAWWLLRRRGKSTDDMSALLDDDPDEWDEASDIAREGKAA